MAKLKLPPIQYSADGKMALQPTFSQRLDPSEIWWNLLIKSPKHGGWVTVQGGTNGHWMTDLGFNPNARA
jgi:hypothetical protein